VSLFLPPIGPSCVPFTTIWPWWRKICEVIANTDCGDLGTATWWETCDPAGACGKILGPPQKPPKTPPPKRGQPCYYPNRRVSIGGVSAESQCICQCAGNSKGMNCVRGCIRCASKQGAPPTVLTELACKNACNLTVNEQKRLDCCVSQTWNLGGCGAPPFEFPPHLNPNPANTACTGLPIP
jgi:hypothetical protein